MSARSRCASAALCFIALPTAANAQTANPIEAEGVAAANTARGAAAERQARQGASLMSEGSPDDRAMAGFVKPKLSFTSEDDETSVSLAFSFDLQSATPRVDEKKQTDSGTNFVDVSWIKGSVVATAPIEEGGKGFSRLFSGDSLIGGAKVKIGISGVHNTLGNARGAEKYLPQAFDNCLDTTAKAWEGDFPTGFAADSYLPGLQAQARSDGRPIQNLVRVRGTAANAEELDKHLFEQCVPQRGNRFVNASQVVEAYTPYGPEFIALFYDKGSWMKLWGFDGSVGQEDYEYLDSVAFDNADVSKTSWEVGAYAGLINWNGSFSARLRGVYGKTWELPEETETCETFGNPPEEHCLTGPDGPPTAVETGLISFEARQKVKLGETTEIAFAPQVTYRFEDDYLGVEVPVYLVPDENGKLTGGLKFAYNSKDDAFGIGLFVGVPLNDLFE